MNFTINGRLRRKDYAINLFFISLWSSFFGWIGNYDQRQFGLVALIGIIIFIILGFIQAFKRIQDINLNRFSILLFFVPLINSIFGLYLLIKDGTVGENRYGLDPKGRVRAQ